jgi:hypothetical protein
MAHNMTEEEIIGLVESEINGSSDYMDSEISSQRERAMEYFYGEPFGNEEDGRSQVVVTDVQDTLMWMMPSLMRIFTGRTGHQVRKSRVLQAERRVYGAI